MLQDGLDPVNWQLAQKPLGTADAHRGYTQVFGYIQALGSPTGAIHKCSSIPRCLDPQTGRRTGDWIPKWGYTWFFLDSQPQLHTGVRIPK